MAATAKVFHIKNDTHMKITKIKVKKGQQVAKGSLLCFFKENDDVLRRYKSCHDGVVKEIQAKEGEEYSVGSNLFTLEGCSHPTVMKDMCADCGADLRMENSSSGTRKEEVSASVAMVHSIPELIVSEELAQELGKADEERLVKTRKLVLLVDLDQTLIHTTNDNIPANLKDVEHYQLWHGPQLLWYHTRIRPHTKKFLEHIAQLFELHICTFGSRIYAHTIAKILDPDGKYFSHRILSRDECFNASSKTANLKALFPCGDSMVCIIDDREDVWNYSPNLIHVKPYRFFQGTADINAPPGLAKTEQDDQPITHKVRRVSQSGEEIPAKYAPTNNKIAESGVPKPSQTVNGEGSHSDDDAKSEKENEEKSSNNKEEKKENKMEIEDEEKSSENEGLAKEKLSEDSKEENEVETSKEVTSVGKEDLRKENQSEQVDEENKENSSENKTVEDVTESELKTDSVGEDKNKNNIDKKSEKDEDKNDKKDKNEAGDTKTDDKKENAKQDEDSKEDEMIEWDDDDDYLFHLEEILQRIHNAFFDMYDQLKDKGLSSENEKPNLRKLVPYVKKKVLKGCNIVFSGVIPTNMQPEKSRAYIVAKNLGANIQTELRSKENELDPQQFTTHLVAARLGTQKVRNAQRLKKLQVVSQDWLWCCNERWEKVEESLFPLTIESTAQDRASPDPSKMKMKTDLKRKLDKIDTADEFGCDSKKIRSGKNDVSEMSSVSKDESKPGPSTSMPANDDDKMKGQEMFSHTYNPMLAFSDDDIAYMDKEVEDEMDDSGDESSEEEEARNERIRTSVLKHSTDDADEASSSDESMTGNMPRGWGLHKKKTSPRPSSDDDDKKKSPPKELGSEYESETDQDKFDKIMDAFGPETENSELDNDDYEESIGSVDDEMADAIEKEFLS